jgi:hypothetical protein
MQHYVGLLLTSKYFLQCALAYLEKQKKGVFNFSCYTQMQNSQTWFFVATTGVLNAEHMNHTEVQGPALIISTPAI